MAFFSRGEGVKSYSSHLLSCLPSRRYVKNPLPTQIAVAQKQADLGGGGLSAPSRTILTLLFPRALILPDGRYPVPVGVPLNA